MKHEGTGEGADGRGDYEDVSLTEENGFNTTRRTTDNMLTMKAEMKMTGDGDGNDGDVTYW